MPRYFYWFLAIAIIFGIAVGAFLFTYKTEPATPMLSTAIFGSTSLRIEYATTTAEREKGLGGRTIIPDDYGMLFVFPKEDWYGFWMKDTLVPLDMFWLDPQGRVVSMALDVSPSTYPNVFYPSEPAMYVLETAAGFALSNNIATGTQLMLKNIPIVSQ